MDKYHEIYSKIEPNYFKGDYKCHLVESSIEKVGIRETEYRKIVEHNLDDFKSMRFSNCATQFHQKYTKKSLSMVVKNSKRDKNIFKLVLQSDKNTLFETTIISSNAFSAKNFGWLKYLEYYFFDVFTEIRMIHCEPKETEKQKTSDIKISEIDEKTKEKKMDESRSSQDSEFGTISDA